MSAAPSSSPREVVLLVLTVMRLGIGAGLCIAVWLQTAASVGTLWLVAVVVTDIGDGIVARRLGVDTNLRRIVDVVVDRLTIHTAVAVLMIVEPATVWLLLPVVVRDAVLIGRNVWLLAYKRVIVTPGIIHRVGTLLYAVLYATLLYTTGPAAVWVAVGVLVVVWFLLLDYLRAGALVAAEPRGAPLVRYQACGLRALRGLPPIRRSAFGT